VCCAHQVGWKQSPEDAQDSVVVNEAVVDTSPTTEAVAAVLSDSEGNLDREVDSLMALLETQRTCS